jgi:hypothetical protein
MRAVVKFERATEDSKPIMAITTSNSTKVKPRDCLSKVIVQAAVAPAAAEYLSYALEEDFQTGMKTALQVAS